MSVRHRYNITTFDNLVLRTYNPTTYIPLNIWERMYKRGELTIKSLIILGWRVKSLRECRLFGLAFSDLHDQDRLLDIVSVLGNYKKRVHIKFTSRESSIVSKIYEQHIRYRTTISNYLLYLFLTGFYANSRVVTHYSNSIDRIKLAYEDENMLKEMMKTVLKNVLKNYEDIVIFKNRIITELSRTRRRSTIRHIKRINNENDKERLISYILDSVIFNIKPGALLKTYVKNCIGYV